MNNFKLLDDDQRKIVTSDDNNILVIAGAGSGKTFCITERIRYLILQGVDPAKIVAITFTNMAADEMKDRLGNIEHLFIGTIHSYANYLLQKNQIGADSWFNKPNQFDKLLELGIEKANTSEAQYVLVDEFQDVGALEYDFIMGLNAISYFFVGDDYQALYKFKGANIKYFFDLIHNPEYNKYYLKNNYRCGANIILKANKEIDKIRKKVPKDTVIKAPYNGIVESKSLLHAINEVKQSKDFKNWFILTRTNKEAETIGDFLMENWIPYVTFKKSENTLDGMQILLDSDAVKLLTIHSAKGLEADNVIITGLRYWNDDELRVNYVAMTRAKERLIIC